MVGPRTRGEPSGKWKSTLEVSEEGLEIAKDDRERARVGSL